MSGRASAPQRCAAFSRFVSAAAQFLVIDVPWKYGVGEVSLYQRDLVETFLASAALTNLLNAAQR